MVDTIDLHLRFPRAIFLAPSLADVSQFPGRPVQPSESALGPDNQLILILLCCARNVGRHAVR